jgi:alkylation response protein AidB-like acyl-CoA dehydrogenase
MFLFLHAAVALGAARSAIRALVELAGKKQTMFGTVLATEAYASSLLARAEVQISAARSYALTVIGDIWPTLVACKEPTPDQRAHFRLAIILAHEASIEAVDAIYRAGGGSSIYASGPFDRILRDVHTAAQHAIGSPRNYESAGRLLLGLDPGDPTF